MDGIIDERDDNVVRIVLARPDRGNALDAAMGARLRDIAAACRADRSVRAVLMTAQGRLFCAGGDLGAMGTGSDIAATIAPMTRDFHHAIADFAAMDAPLIVAVQGATTGAGVSLVAVADYAIAARSAAFAYAYPGVGFTADGGPTWTLPRLVGLRAFQSLYLGGAKWTADVALEHGLLNEVVDDDALADRAIAFAEQLAVGPTRAFAGIKRLAAASFKRDLPSQLDAELEELLEAAGTEDARGAIEAVSARQPAKFEGR